MVELIVYVSPQESARVAQAMQAQDLRGWAKQVEDFMSASGTRCLLTQVTPDHWMRYFAANAPAYDAVIAELQKVCD